MVGVAVVLVVLRGVEVRGRVRVVGVVVDAVVTVIVLRGVVRERGTAAVAIVVVATVAVAGGREPPRNRFLLLFSSSRANSDSEQKQSE